MKILTIIFKAAVVSRARAKFKKHVTSNSSVVAEDFVHTGKNFDRNMSDVFLKKCKPLSQIILSISMVLPTVP